MPVPVDVTAASTAVLGGAPLPPLAAAYLDATGNRNGGYDLGDLVAWLRRTGERIPPVLSRERSGGSPR